MTSDESLDEFIEDFGSPPFSEQELEHILDRARQNGDATLRGLVKELKAMRWIGRILLERIETRSVAADEQAIKVARFLLRGPGATAQPRHSGKGD